jgi:hypothetical protein
VSISSTLSAIFDPPSPAVAQGASGAPASSVDDSGFSFHDLLSIVNPLQHLPVIGTLYRAITGDTIKTPEKIAGDALYGGLWGAVASVADAAFQAVTGKDVGDTVLALFTGDHASASIGVAANTPPATAAAASPAPLSAPVPAPAPAAANNDPNIAALTASLASKGVDSETAQRAIFAYQKSMTLPTAVLATVQ